MDTVKERISCRDDDGAKVEVIVMQRWVATPPDLKTGRPGSQPAGTYMILADNRDVVLGDEPETFKILQNGKVLRRV